MTTEGRRYRFAPLERRGLLLGLGAAQLATMAAGCIAALGVVRTGSAGDGLFAAFAVLATSGVLACWPVAGRTPVTWAPVVVGWILRRRGGPRCSPAPLLGQRPVPGVRRFRMVRLSPVPGVTVVEAPHVPGGNRLGVIRDQRGTAWSALLGIEGRSFALLDAADKQRRLAAWGAFLAALGRPGSPIHRVQWVERSAEGTSDQLRQYLASAGHGDVQVEARRSYERLIDGAGPATQRHETLLAISVHPRRASRALRSFGRGESAVCELLQREVRLLCGQARGADLPALSPLSVPEVIDALALAGDLGATSSDGAGPSRRGRQSLRGIWPMATDEAWSAVRADGAWFATFWVAEWPRLDVGPDFLSPLLLAGGRRTISVVMAPVDPQRAVRELGSARTADMADDELRRRAGFVPSTRRRREAEGVVQRESELADGHAEYRFSGYVTVAGDDRRHLEAACAEVEQAARRAHLELRRLYGRQEEALTWTLPLSRGLS